MYFRGVFLFSFLLVDYYKIIGQQWLFLYGNIN